MKRRSWLVLPALLAFAAAATFAGGDHYKCTQGTQECLDMMAAKYSKKGWIGLEFDKTEEDKMTIKRVVEDSPAVEAGFREGDVLIAVNGVALYSEQNEEKIKAQWEGMTPGKKMEFTVSRNGYEKKLTATLSKVPSEVLAAWVGNHMLDHATTAIAQN